MAANGSADSDAHSAPLTRADLVEVLSAWHAAAAPVPPLASASSDLSASTASATEHGATPTATPAANLRSSSCSACAVLDAELVKTQKQLHEARSAAASAKVTSPAAATYAECDAAALTARVQMLQQELDNTRGRFEDLMAVVRRCCETERTLTRGLIDHGAYVRACVFLGSQMSRMQQDASQEQRGDRAAAWEGQVRLDAAERALRDERFAHSREIHSLQQQLNTSEIAMEQAKMTFQTTVFDLETTLHQAHLAHADVTRALRAQVTDLDHQLYVATMQIRDLQNTASSSNAPANRSDPVANAPEYAANVGARATSPAALAPRSGSRGRPLSAVASAASPSRDPRTARPLSPELRHPALAGLSRHSSAARLSTASTLSPSPSTRHLGLGRSSSQHSGIGWSEHHAGSSGWPRERSSYPYHSQPVPGSNPGPAGRTSAAAARRLDEGLFPIPIPAVGPVKQKLSQLLSTLTLEQQLSAATTSVSHLTPLRAIGSVQVHSPASPGPGPVGVQPAQANAHSLTPLASIYGGCLAQLDALERQFARAGAAATEMTGGSSPGHSAGATEAMLHL